MTDPYHVDNADAVFLFVRKRLQEQDKKTELVEVSISKKTLDCLEKLTQSSGKTVDHTIQDLLKFQSNYWLIKNIARKK